MGVQLRGRIGRQRTRRHRRSEIGTADADIDEIGHRLTQRAADAALANIVGERSTIFRARSLAISGATSRPAGRRRSGRDV